MRETMRDAPGVGLAAPQVGVGFQVAVVEDQPEYTRDTTVAALEERERTPVPFHVIINPQITASEGPDVAFFEGCLSMAGFTALVPRSRSVTVEAFDHTGERRTIHASGWYARILQHEIDHLNGTLYIDRMHPRTLATVENFNRHWKDRPIDETRRLLGIEA